MRRTFLPLAFLTALLVISTIPSHGAAQSVVLRIAWRNPEGRFRALHGINKGPLVAGGLIDLTRAHRALEIPSVRLHDCHWPNADVVDIHVVFPDFRADPAVPESYDFVRTDAYLQAVRDTGAQIVYRLGENIEHTTDRRFTHPPQDAAKWADICLGIIRHYNDAWANGFRFGIRYWEIWNEPENRPAMWSGTDADYFELYKTTAVRVKASYPDVAVGGPAAGSVGTFQNGKFMPSSFVSDFVASCRTENVPLDFFSWHFYGNDPADIALRTRAIRVWLDNAGFARTEIHLNEWNFLPRNDWAPVGRAADPHARRAHYAEIAGPGGASFIVAALIMLQDAPVDVCALFHGEVGGFGLFDEFGVPTKSYEGLRAFARLLKTPRRLRVETSLVLPGKAVVAAGTDQAGATVHLLAANHEAIPIEFVVDPRDFPWPGPLVLELRRVSATESFDHAEQRTLTSAENIPPIAAPAQSVTFVSLRKP